MIRNVFSLLLGNIICIVTKICHWKRFQYHSFLRLNKRVKIRIDKNSILKFNKGILIESNTVISVTDGGYLAIGSMVGINRNSMIMCHESIIIGDNTIMGPGVYIYDHDHIFDSNHGVKRNEYVASPIKIGKNCWIGAGTIILRGSTIGNNCLIAAGSVVKGNFPDGSVIIQKREEIIKQKTNSSDL